MPNQHSEAYREGWKAFHDGKTLADGPAIWAFRRGDWEEGYKAAQEGEQLVTTEYLNDKS